MTSEHDDEKLALGVIGCQGYGRTARKYFRNAGEFDIVACLDIDPDVAKRAADEEQATAYTDMDAFLRHDGMQAVSINTPVWLHAPHSQQALEAGKHVFVTKPVADTVEAAERVLSLARERGLVYMVGHHARHALSRRFVRDILRSDRLGRLCNAALTCCSSAGLTQKAGDWRTLPGKNPGGPLLQCGIHTIDFLISVFGHVESVFSVMQDDVTEFDVVDNTQTLLTMPGGIVVSFTCNYTTAYLHTMSFFGTKANLHHLDHVSGLRQEQVYLQQRETGIHEPWMPLQIPSNPSYPDKHGGILERSFASQIRTGRPDYTNLHDSINALAVIEAAVASHQRRQPVTVEPKADTP